MQPPLTGYAGPAGLVDYYIGEQYLVVKAVYDVLGDLAGVKTAVEQMADVTALIANITAMRDQALAVVQPVLDAKAATLTYQTQATSQATLAGTKATAAAASAAAALVSEGNALNYKNQAQTFANSMITSVGLAQQWAVQTDSEVAVGIGFGAKKYALDAAASSTTAGTSAAAAVAAQAAAETARNNAVAIAGFDPNLYALKSYAKRVARRAALFYGS